MYGRRTSPYSRIEEIHRTRGEIVAIVFVTVLLALLINLLSSGVYDLLTSSVGSLSSVIRFSLHLIGSVVLVLAIALIALVLIWQLSKQKTQVVHLDVVVPYIRRPKASVEVLRQHQFRPQYQVVEWAYHIWHGRWRNARESLRRLTDEWITALHGEAPDERIPIQTVMSSDHLQLVEAILLAALERYCDRSLRPRRAFVYAWTTNLAARQWTMADLPEFWRENPYVEGWLRQDMSKWNILLPERMRINRICNADRYEIQLHLPGCGMIVIAYYKQSWVSRSGSQPAVVLGDGAPMTLGRGSEFTDYYVFGTHMEIHAQFENVFVSHNDVYYEWAAGMIASLEEALDWRYFLQLRTDKIVSDLAWKIGDLPRQESVWEKLDSMEMRLRVIEQRLSSGKTE